MLSSSDLSNRKHDENSQTKNYNRLQEVLNNGKNKKETHACPKTRKEEGKGRKAEEIHVGLHEWQAQQMGSESI